MQEFFPIPLEEAELHPISSVPNTGKKFIQVIDPEFSSVCPKTGLPDFGRIIIQYNPDTRIAELKDRKLYIRSFYGVGIMHEHVTQEMALAIASAIEPKRVIVARD